MAGTFNEYLNAVLTKIYANNNLCKLLIYDVPNPLSQPNLPDNTILYTDKLNRRIFTTPFNLDQADVQKTTLTINIFDSKPNYNNYTRDTTIEFIILSHYALWELDTTPGYANNRPNLIIDELIDTFYHTGTVGMDINNLRSLNAIQPNQYYGGFVLRLSSKDWINYCGI